MKDKWNKIGIDELTYEKIIKFKHIAIFYLPLVTIVFGGISLGILKSKISYLLIISNLLLLVYTITFRNAIIKYTKYFFLLGFIYMFHYSLSFMIFVFAFFDAAFYFYTYLFFLVLFFLQ